MIRHLCSPLLSPPFLLNTAIIKMSIFSSPTAHRLMRSQFPQYPFVFSASLTLCLELPHIIEVRAAYPARFLPHNRHSAPASTPLPSGSPRAPPSPILL